MRIVKLVLVAAIPFALLGCPEEKKPTPDPAASGVAAKAAVPSGAPAGSAAPAKSGAGW
jgi:hypothetical protein